MARALNDDYFRNPMVEIIGDGSDLVTDATRDLFW
jgi:hypothetical protein